MPEMNLDMMDMILLISIGMFIGRFLYAEKLRKMIEHQKEMRQKQIPQDIAAKLDTLRNLTADRLGMDFSRIPPDADWIHDLRIPRGELHEFFEDTAEVFLIGDSSSLSKTATLRETLEYLGLPVPETQKS